MRSKIYGVATTLGLASAMLCLSLAVEAQQSDRVADVQSLYNQCNEGQTSVRYALCVGYVSGVGHQLFTNGVALKYLKSGSPEFNTMAAFGACTNSFVSNGAMIQAFINWAKQHPAKWSEPAQMGVMQAIIETWSCLPK